MLALSRTNIGNTSPVFCPARRIPGAGKPAKQAVPCTVVEGAARLPKPEFRRVGATAYQQQFEVQQPPLEPVSFDAPPDTPAELEPALALATPDAPVNVEQATLNLWQRYCVSLDSNPAPTKAATSFMGFMIGDLLAQYLEGANSIDAARLVRMGSYGLLLDGPVGHMWYQWLDGTCDKVFKDPKGAASVTIKTAADQLIWAPVMTAVFFAFIHTMEGNPGQIMPTIQDKLLATVAANYVIWPAAHVISFKFVPSQQRILYNNTIAIFWNCYMSLVAAGSIPNLFNMFDASGDKLQDAIGVDLDKMGGLAQVAKGVKDSVPADSVWLHPMVQASDTAHVAAQHHGVVHAASNLVSHILHLLPFQ